MANEINIQAILAFQRSTVMVQGCHTKTFDQTPGTRGISTIKKPTNAAPVELVTEITITGTKPYYLFIKNLDATLNVEIALDNNFAAPATGKLFALLLPDQFCFVPVYPGAHVWARPASGGPVDVQVAAVEA